MNKSVLRMAAIACLSFALVLIGAIVSGDNETYAASTKKSTVYYDVYKVKNYAYCNTGHKIYKVNLKTKKAKLILEDSIYIENMKVHRGYVYYSLHYDIYGSNLYRIKTNGTGKKRLASLGHISNSGRVAPPYVITGSQIYYLQMNRGVKKTMKMKLNGKNKKRVSGIKLKMITKTTNAKGYKLVVSFYDVTDVGDYYLAYLKSPKGKKTYLGKDNNLIWGEFSYD